jgi:3-methyladenine DNA glycosylase AlkD
MGAMKTFAKGVGKDHELALDLWKTGSYEARTVAVHVADPAELTRAQMDVWVGDMDNWAICDTACVHLFDRTPFAWNAQPDWAASPGEFVRRAAFALVWALSVHDKTASDARFKGALRLIDEAASDDRTYVKKAVDMALRAIGKRNLTLNDAARATARDLASSEDRTRAWIGRHALRELESEKVRSRLEKKAEKRGGGGT